MADSTRPEALGPYLDAGWQLIPLHSHDYFDQHKGKKRARGKSPLHPNWTKRPYRSAEQAAHMRAGNNVGVRLRATDLVLDVDPRNFAEGDDPLARLCEDVGLCLDLFPHVVTGSGGHHYYMTKPGDVSVRDSLEDYEGLEFKTLGRQVVSAGSIHPDTGRTYDWDELGQDLSSAPPAPDRLLNLIRRPATTSASTGGGEFDQEEVAAMLDALDPEDFRDYDEWLTLMMACHHASNGDARAEFIEWSTRDPQYGGEGTAIGRKWDSLHANRRTGPSVTYKTLLKALTDRGLGDAVPRTPPEDDFEDDPDLSGIPDAPDVPEHERLGPIDRVNLDHIATVHGGKFRVFYEETDWEAGPEPRKVWRNMEFGQWALKMANEPGLRYVDKATGKEKTISLAQAWLQSRKRRSADQVIFDPEHDRPGCLNLWTGWAVEPRKGDWSILQEALHDALCDGDDAVYDYVLDWSAYMVQHPGRPAEVALCFQGPKGAGKGTFCRALKDLAGRHGMAISSSKQVTGRFNNHLRDCILLFCDEAINPYDKDAEAMLKSMITEPRIAFEPKGVDIRMGQNRLHLVMASNEDWFIPMGLEHERRFMLQRVNDSWRGRLDRFDALNDQLDGGGRAAMLFDLLNRDIRGWAPRRGVPHTRAAADQKLRGLSPVGQWWFNVLCEGDAPGEPTVEGAAWWLEPIRVFRGDLQASFREYCSAAGIRAGASSRGIEMVFGAEMRKLVPRMRPKVREVVPEHRVDVRSHSDGRAWAAELPCLGDCREAFEALLGSKYDW